VTKGIWMWYPAPVVNGSAIIFLVCFVLLFIFFVLVVRFVVPCLFFSPFRTRRVCIRLLSLPTTTPKCSLCRYCSLPL
jgi:hypothetical protein